MTIGNGARDPRISSLDDARRRKAEKDKAARRAARQSGGPVTIGQRLFGLAVLAMSLGYIAWLAGLLGGDAALVPTPGAQ